MNQTAVHIQGLVWYIFYVVSYEKVMKEHLYDELLYLQQ